MTKTTETELTFNQTNITSLVDGLFNENRTLASFIAYNIDGLIITAKFSNKNADGSCQTTSVTFSSKEHLNDAKLYLDKKISDYRHTDRSFLFGYKYASTL